MAGENDASAYGRTQAASGIELATITIYVDTAATVNSQTAQLQRADATSEGSNVLLSVSSIGSLLKDELGDQVREVSAGQISLARLRIEPAESFEVVMVLVSAATALTKAKEIIDSLETIARLSRRLVHAIMRASNVGPRTTTARIVASPALYQARGESVNQGATEKVGPATAGSTREGSDAAAVSNSRMLYILALNVLIGLTIIVLLFIVR